MKPTDFDVLTFDCYGTLIDWEQGLLDALEPWLHRRGKAEELSRAEILETYAGVESELEATFPGRLYSEILADGIRRLGGLWGLEGTAEGAAAFGASVPDWPAFPDSPDALRYLGEHYELVILSNVDRKSFAGSEKRLGVSFDHVFTAEEIGSYKPDPRNFHYLLERLAEHGVDRSRILHVAQSLFHDHVPAQAEGLRTAWVDRRHDQPGWGATPEASVTPDVRLTSMEALAQAHREGAFPVSSLV